jgi:hypothetical protein
MSALFAGHVAALAALAVALLIIAAITVAAALALHRTGAPARRRQQQKGARDHVIDERIKARVEALIWPE